MKSLKIFILVLLCFLSSELMAQRSYFMRYHRKMSFVNNVDVDFGKYYPSLDALNKYSPISIVGISLDGGYKGTVGAYTHLYMDGYLGVFGGYYYDKTEGTRTVGGITRTESLKYTAIPIGVKFIHEFHLGDPFLHRPRAAGLLLIHPYVGLGTTFWRMRQEFHRTATGGLEESPTPEGTTYQTFTLIGGLKYTIAKNLDLGAEYNFEVGGFNQQLQYSNSADQVEYVSAAGSAVTLKLTYLLNQRLEWRYVQKVRRFR